MQNNWILFPLLLQIILTAEAYIALAWMRGKAAKGGAANLKRASLHDDAWPDRVAQFSNNVRNQFELPVLFYVLTVILWQMQAAGAWAQGAAWVFVVSRVVHAFIHTGKNNVPLRFGAFLIGVVAVLVMAGLVAKAAFIG
jgi:hypothetical protein